MLFGFLAPDLGEKMGFFLKSVNSTNFANFWEKKAPKFQYLKIEKQKKPNPRGWNFLLFKFFASKIICEFVLFVWFCLLFF
jgi:hypothetical protein